MARDAITQYAAPGMCMILLLSLACSFTSAAEARPAMYGGLELARAKRGK
jgi:hypothetical protein